MSYVQGSGDGSSGSSGSSGGFLSDLVASLFGTGGGGSASSGGSSLDTLASQVVDPTLAGTTNQAAFLTMPQVSPGPQFASLGGGDPSQGAVFGQGGGDPSQATSQFATALTNATQGIPTPQSDPGTDPNDPTGGNQSPSGPGGPNDPRQQGGQESQGAQPWGRPAPGSGGQTPPPGYLPVSRAPNAPGGSPSGQGAPQGGSQDPGIGGGGGRSGGGGGRMPMPAPQGAGAVGNMGGAAAIPLPALIQALMRQYQGQRPPWAVRSPRDLTRPNYGFGAGRYTYPGQRGDRPRYVPRGTQEGSRAPPGLGGTRGPVPQGPNYMQRLYQGQYPPSENAMRSIQTPAGPMKVNPLAAGDVQGFTRDLQQHGFPLEKPWGSYNRRRMRWSNNWSSHAWGTAFDIDNQDGPMSPRARQWMQQNPGLFQQLLRRWNMSQPLPGRDPRHIEWTGPRNQGGSQMAGGGEANIPYHTATPAEDWHMATPAEERQHRKDLLAPPSRDVTAAPVTTDPNDPTGGSQSPTGGAPAAATPPATAPANADPAAPDLSSMFAADDTEEEDDSAVA